MSLWKSFAPRSGFHYDLLGERRSQPRHSDSRTPAAAVLDDALREQEVFFWGVHTGGELDMVFQRRARLCGVELKFQDAPRMTPSLHSALDELQLAHLWVVYPGQESYSLARNVRVIPLTDLAQIDG